MTERRWNVLHAIHDFLPRHRAGSEIYAFDLCRALAARHHVTVLCAEYDPGRPHGHVTWRIHDGQPVIEIVNNWTCASFAETYRPPLIGERIRHALRAVQPDIVHVHNLLNLSFDLPAAARAIGVPVVATLHDYTLVCPSGGQRVHLADAHVCHEIEPDRCARCFRESPFYAQIGASAVVAAVAMPPALRRLAMRLKQRAPALAGRVARTAARAAGPAVTASDISERLAAARSLFDDIDLFVAPSLSLAAEYERLGLDRSKIRVVDNGMLPLTPAPKTSGTNLRVGFVGTVAWHKGVHVLVEALGLMPAGTCELMIFGSLDTFPEYSAGLRAKAAGLPVRYMGSFDRDGAAEVYAQFDVLVVPSLWLENSPLVIHEAFMAGVPIVAARIGGIADLVTHGENGLLYDASSPAELAAALRRCIDDPALLARLAATPTPVRSIADDARGWDDLYGEMIRRRGATRSA